MEALQFAAAPKPTPPPTNGQLRHALNFAKNKWSKKHQEKEKRMEQMFRHREDLAQSERALEEVVGEWPKLKQAIGEAMDVVAKD